MSLDIYIGGMLPWVHNTPAWQIPNRQLDTSIQQSSVHLPSLTRRSRPALLSLGSTLRSTLYLLNSPAIIYSLQTTLGRLSALLQTPSRGPNPVARERRRGTRFSTSSNLRGVSRPLPSLQSKTNSTRLLRGKRYHWLPLRGPTH